MSMQKTTVVKASNLDVPLQNADREEQNRKPDARLVDEFLRTTPLHVHCAAAAECRREAGRAVLQQDAEGEQNTDDDLDVDKHGG